MGWSALWSDGQAGEKRTLRPAAGQLGALATSENALTWSHDTSKCAQKEYPIRCPWDVLAIIVIFSTCAVAVAAELRTRGPVDEAVRHLGLYAVPGIVLALVALALNPVRVSRRTDALVFDFPLHQRAVPLKDILELAVLDNYSGTHPFLSFLLRWGVFPFGCQLHCFCGVPSCHAAVCVVLTRHRCGNVVFCPEDPIEFLVDNQRPLDLRARYWNTHEVLVREGESLRSKMLGRVPRGSFLRIEQQRGRRVLVEFEGGGVRGWMSYVNRLGRFLLAKEREAGGPSVGVVGASELEASYGTAIELASLVHSVEEGE